MLSEFSEAQMQPLVVAFRDQLQRLGWNDGSFNIDLRFAIADAAQFKVTAAAIVATRPDVIAALGSRALRALKEIEPRVKRILLLVNPQNSGTLALAKSVEAMGPDYAVEMVPGHVRTVADIEIVLDQFGSGADRAVIVLPDGLVVNNRAMLIERINRARLPAVFPFRSFTQSGGLLSWGLDFVDVYRQAAVYADRLLRGEKPSDLPIQAPNKFDLSINLKTARALGFTMPPTLLAVADEVIE